MKPDCYVLPLLLVATAALSGIGSAQTIPNAGFETWSSGIPAGWGTSNDPPTYINVTQSTDSHSGSFAIRGEVTDIGLGFGYSPSVYTDPLLLANARPVALHGWYKSSLLGGAMLHIVVAMSKGDSGIGGASLPITSSSDTYKEFVANILYLTGDIPDSAEILMSIAGTATLAAVGSNFVIDDLSWGGATAIEEDKANLPQGIKLEQNHPNPFNPTTSIGYSVGVVGLPAGQAGGQSSVASSHVRLAVYDMLGREAAVLVNEEKVPGRYEVKFDGSGLASGVYIYRLQAGNFVETRKLTLLK
jgi:hypothetical protein